MKITIYELLGMVKDGKTPKKIKYNNIILSYDKEMSDYYKYYGGYLFSYLFGKDNLDFLNNEIEILEEEKKIPEKLDIYADISGDLACEWSFPEDKLKDKINEIIDYLKSKGE